MTPQHSFAPLAPGLPPLTRLAAAIALGCALAWAGLPNAWAAPPAKAAGKSTATKAETPVTLNFVNADIESVARTLAPLSSRNLVIDPRVKGTVTLSTDNPVSPSDAWAQFLAVLRLQGFAAVETRGLVKIVPEAEAKLQGGSVLEVDKAPASGSGQVVTQIFRLQHEQAANLVPVLRPLITANNTINLTPGTNTLVITDYADNLQRIARIVSALDVANASDVDVVPLRHGIAIDLVPLLQRLIDSGAATTPAGAPAPGGAANEGVRTTVLAEPRSNSLIVRAANPARLALVRALIDKLDQPGSQSASGNIHVVYLKNADATKLAVTLRAALASSLGQTAATGVPGAMPTTASNPALGTNPATAASGGALVFGNNSAAGAATGGQIQADVATNSLIITAPEPQYRQLRAVIDQLDQRRAQVLVESLIAEVNADKAAQMGIQWQGGGNQSGGSVGIIGTNFNNPLATSQGQGNLLGISANGTTALNQLGNGLNIGNVRNIQGTYVLGSLATFLEKNGDGNILSTPTLLTLDNEEAKIVVGQNVPFVTGQFTNNNTANGSVNPFQTIERKDVGLTLRVKPQISETGTVKLTIYQEVSNVDPASVASATGLITNKRSIESNVLVNDGAIVVLGGLLSDEFSENRSQVPGLGDVPLLGWLFKSEGRSRKKSNLMVFLRPVVVRDAAASDALSNSRYLQMMGLQQNAQPNNSNPLINVGGAPVLPPLPGAVAPAGTAPAAQPATEPR